MSHEMEGTWHMARARIEPSSLEIVLLAHYFATSAHFLPFTYFR
jgi:hypothetical protein